MNAKTERKWVFSWLDLIFPWGICLLAAALCLWAVIAGKPIDGKSTAPKIVAGAVGAVFLLSIPLWYFVRSRFRRYSFKTKHGVYAVLGLKNRPTQGMVEKWSDDLILHWSDKEFTASGKTYRLTAAQVAKALEEVTIFYLDEHEISSWGRMVRGYCLGKDIVIGYKSQIEQGIPDWKYVESLTRHEMSHTILDGNGVEWNEKIHHEIFSSSLLGA